MPVSESRPPDRPSPGPLDPQGETSRPPGARQPAVPRHWVVPLAALAVLFVLAALAWQVWGSRPPVTGDAEWIWAELPERLPSPTAFYLVRDFPVPAELADARLLVQGDEEYVLHLNGRRLGSNRYRPGAPLDVYPLDGLLLPGMNRIAVEMRSSRGAGGFLAALDVGGLDGGTLDGGGGETLLVSDSEWRVVRHYAPGLVEGWLPLPELAPAGGGEGDGGGGSVEDGAAEGGTVEDGAVEDGAEGQGGASTGLALTAERPISWGRPPAGRWSRPRAGEPRPPLEVVGDPCPAGPVLAPDGGGDGQEGADAVRALFDFGRQVTGYLVVAHPPTAPTAPAQVNLFALGDGPLVLLPPGSGQAGSGQAVPGQAAPGAVPAREVAEVDALPLVTLPGRGLWTDVVPRTFRYAAVAGLRPPLSVAVLEVDPGAVAALPGATRGEAAEPGLAGLPPRPRRTPAEDSVRRRLADAAEKAGSTGQGDIPGETGAPREGDSGDAGTGGRTEGAETEGAETDEVRSNGR